MPAIVLRARVTPSSVDDSDRLTLDALCAGERDPEVFAGMAKSRLRKKQRQPRPSPTPPRQPARTPRLHRRPQPRRLARGTHGNFVTPRGHTAGVEPLTSPDFAWVARRLAGVAVASGLRAPRVASPPRLPMRHARSGGSPPAGRWCRFGVIGRPPRSSRTWSRASSSPIGSQGPRRPGCGGVCGRRWC